MLRCYFTNFLSTIHLNYYFISKFKSIHIYGLLILILGFDICGQRERSKSVLRSCPDFLRLSLIFEIFEFFLSFIIEMLIKFEFWKCKESFQCYDSMIIFFFNDLFVKLPSGINYDCHERNVFALFSWDMTIQSLLLEIVISGSKCLRFTQNFFFLLMSLIITFLY